MHDTNAIAHEPEILWNIHTNTTADHFSDSPWETGSYQRLQWFRKYSNFVNRLFRVENLSAILNFLALENSLRLGESGPATPLGGGAVPVWSMNDYSVDWKCYNGQRLTVDVNDSDSTWMTSEYTARTLTDSAVRHEADTCQRQYSLKKYRVKVVSTLEQTTGPTRQTCWNKSSEWVYGCYRGGAQK